MNLTKTRSRHHLLVGIATASLGLAFGLGGIAMGDYLPPPYGPIDWNWKVPTDHANRFTRTQFHSFASDPNPPDTAPDYTYNGYPSLVADSWSLGGSVGTNFGSAPADSAWGDGVGVAIGAGQPFAKTMGNVRVASYTKQYFAEVVWKPQDGTFSDWLDLEVTAPGASSKASLGGCLGPDANGWYMQQWDGRITPQPGQETFSFSVPENVLIDSAWFGTQCCILKPFYQYGADWNHDGDWDDPNEGPTRNTAAGLCAPVATANSFMYLSNHYGLTDLVPDSTGPSGTPDGTVDKRDLDDLRDKLANGWDGKDGMNKRGAPPIDIWNTKLAWCDDHAHGRLVFDGQTEYLDSGVGWKRADVLEDKCPEWNWLWDELKHCEDIELRMHPLLGGSGHLITLTGMCWDDADGDGVLDNSEGKIYYLDPNDGYYDPPNNPLEHRAAVTLGTGGRLELIWWQDGANYYIDSAFSESVPEPVTASMLALAGLVAVGWRRRTRAVRGAA